MKYSFSKVVDISYDDAVARVTEELKKEGFGILTTIDAKQVLKNKLDVDFPRYIILGACNPPFAYKALQAETEVGLLLPCNVIVYEKGGKTNVAVFDPAVIAEIIPGSEIKAIASEVREKLERVLAKI